MATVPQEISTEDAKALAVDLRLNFCRCGQPYAGYECLKTVLEFFDRSGLEPTEWNKKHDEMTAFQQSIGNEPFYLLVYLIEAAGLLEHGSSVTGSWLSNDGEAMLGLLRRHGCDPDKWPGAEKN